MVIGISGDFLLGLRCYTGRSPPPADTFAFPVHTFAFPAHTSVFPAHTFAFPVHTSVFPAYAGIQRTLDSGFHRNDECQTE
jgi:hypothetical protein